MEFTDVFDLDEVAFRQKRWIEYTSKCSTFTVMAVKCCVVRSKIQYKLEKKNE